MYAGEYQLLQWHLQEIIQGEEGGNKMDLKDRAKKLKMDIPAIFLALKDKDTPVPAKIFGGITIVYALSPVDLIPDFRVFCTLGR